MADVFVSYSSDDRKQIQSIVNAIQAAGFSVWWDRAIRLGTSFDKEIERELDAAKCVVVIWSESSVQSDWVRNEAQEGLNRNILVPLSIDGTPPPLAFRHAQTYPIKGKPNEKNLREVLDSIRKVATLGNENSSKLKNESPKRSNVTWLMAIALITVAVFVWYYYSIDGGSIDSNSIPDKNDISTIAVLPLRNISGEPGQDYFGNAISSEIWSKLSRVDGLQVISMTSSSAFRDTTLDVREIGMQLTADFIIEGSAAREGDLARINIHLIDSNNGVELWGTQFQTEIASTRSLFALYDQISSEVGRSLESRVTGTEVLSEPSKVPTEQIAAYNLIQLALFNFAESGNPRDMDPLLDQALELDPEYADAINTKGVVKAFEAEFGLVEARTGYEAARKYALAALEADPTHGHALRQLGQLAARLDLDFKKAMQAYNLAIDANPEVGEDVAFGKGELYLNTGQYEDALREFQIAASYNPGNIWVKMQIGRLLSRMGQIQAASDLFNEILEEAPNNSFILQVSLEHFLDHDLARAEELADTTSPAVLPFWTEARIALGQGQSDLARKHLADWESLRNQRYVSPLVFVFFNWDLGDYSAHIEWWKVAIEEHALLHFTYDYIARLPNYWETLEAWAVEDANEARYRQNLLADHKVRIEQVMKNMTL